MRRAVLVPPGVRLAAREAMVGLVLRGIDDLFRTHEFTDRDESVMGQGQRRTLVEQFHARIDFDSIDDAQRYLDLLGDLLDFVPEGEDAHDPGKLLRKALDRADLVGPDRRLRLPVDQPLQPSDADTNSLWGQDQIRVFFSHVHG